MKKSLLKTSVLIVFFLSCMNLNGAAIPGSVVTKAKEPMKFILNTTDFKSERVKCSIISNEGALVYTDKINTEKEGARLFDMSQLPEGRYIIELEDELKISRYQLEVAHSAIQIDDESTSMYKPVFKKMEAGKIGITMLTLGQTVKIELSDDNEKLHSLIIKDDQAISKIYDLGNLPRGAYQFRVTTKNRTFFHKVNI